MNAAHEPRLSRWEDEWELLVVTLVCAGSHQRCRQASYLRPQCPDQGILLGVALVAKVREDRTRH
jgi:hypothetical protein